MVQRIGKVMSKRIDLCLHGVLQRDVYQLQNYAIEAISSESPTARSYMRVHIFIRKKRFTFVL